MLEALAKLIKRLLARLLGLYRRWRARELERSEYIAAAATAVQAANEQARTLGALSFRASVETQTGEPSPVEVPPRPDGEYERLTQALDTILPTEPPEPVTEPSDDDGQADAPLFHVIAGPYEVDLPDEFASDEEWARIERLSFNEPSEAMARATEYLVKGSEFVAGWIRGLDSDPCEKCVDWADGGRVFSPDEPFKRHTSCQCRPLPVAKSTIKEKA